MDIQVRQINYPDLVLSGKLISEASEYYTCSDIFLNPVNRCLDEFIAESTRNGSFVYHGVVQITVFDANEYFKATFHDMFLEHFESKKLLQKITVTETVDYSKSEDLPSRYNIKDMHFQLRTLYDDFGHDNLFDIFITFIKSYKGDK